MARKKGEGSFSKGADSRGYHSWTLDLGADPVTGKQRHKVIKRKDVKELKKLVREYLRDVEDGAPATSAGTMLSAQWAELWLATIKNHREQTTYESYESTWRTWLKPRIGNVRLDRITTGHIQLAVDDAKNDDKARTAIYVLDIAKRMLNAAKRQKPPLLSPSFDPCDGVVVPEAAPPRDRVLSHEEADEILAELYRTESLGCKGENRRGYGHRHLIRFLLETGLRECEACGLQVVQVNAKAKTIRVAAQLAKAGKGWTIKPYTKARTIRTVPLTDAAAEAIDAHRELVAGYEARAGDGYEDWGLVFASEEGTPIGPRNLARSVERLRDNVNANREKAGMAPMAHWTIHDLRRTFGTRIAQTGANMKVAQTLLGHRRMETTAKVYVIAEQEDMTAAVQAMVNRKKA